MTKHKKSGTKIYKCWADAKQRCTNPNDARWSDYGGRGITMYPEWKKFLPFFNYVSKLENFNKEGYSIDRINNDDGYRPGNVRWSTGPEQGRNKRPYKKNRK